MHKKHHTILLLTLILTLGIVGCGTPASAPADVVAVVDAASAVVDLGPEVEPAVVSELNATDQIAVIDVREDWEYQEGHIDGAALIPLGSLQDRVDEIPTDRPVVLVCRSGNRSGQAYDFLRREGFDNVHNMTGGMIAWEAAGLDIAR